MTTAAVEAELAVVNVVGAMTIRTAAAESRLLRHRSPVAVFARNVPMCAGEDEAGLGIVVELPLHPVDRVMAESTVVDEAACMRIDVAMAVDTGLGYFAKNTGLMAGGAFRFGVGPEQREPRQVVVEEHVFLPRMLGMAVKTLRSLGALVRVVVLVA